MNIYVAASFAYEDRAKTEERKKQIEEVVNKIKSYIDAEWYLPYNLKIPNAWDISLEEWSQKVYEEDLKALNNADTIIFISYGKGNNAGAVWEIGYTVGYNQWCMMSNVPYYLLQKKIICIKMTDEFESLMVTQSVDTIITEKEIESYDWKNLPRYKTKLCKIS